MATWQLVRPGTWDYATLGFKADNGAILIAANAPDPFWNSIANGPAETVLRYGVGVGTDPDFVETPEGSVLAYDRTQNQYLPMLPGDFFSQEVVQVELGTAMGTELADPTSPAALQVSANIGALAALVVEMNGDPLGTGHVVIKVDTANGNEINDITWVEAV